MSERMLLAAVIVKTTICSDAIVAGEML